MRRIFGSMSPSGVSHRHPRQIRCPVDRVVIVIIVVCPLERRDNDNGLSERTVLFMTLVMPSGDTGGHVRRGRRRVPLHRGRVRDVLQVRREAGEARLPQRAVDGQPAVHRGPVEDDGPQEAGRVRGAAPRRVRSRHHHVQRPQLVELRQLGDLLFHRGHDHRYAETLVRARTGFILRVLQSENRSGERTSTIRDRGRVTCFLFFERGSFSLPVYRVACRTGSIDPKHHVPMAYTGVRPNWL